MTLIKWCLLTIRLVKNKKLFEMSVINLSKRKTSNEWRVCVQKIIDTTVFFRFKKYYHLRDGK